MRQRLTLFRLLPLMTLAASSASHAAANIDNAAPMHIHTVCVGAQHCRVSGALIARTPGDAGVRKIAVVNGQAQVDEIPGAAKEWDVELQADGYWMPRQHLSFSPGISAALSVWPAAPLRGQFRLQPPADQWPRVFTIGFEQSPGRPGTPVPHGSTIECSVAPDGSWSCPVPAAPLDVVLRAKTFVPHYEWDLKLSPGAGANLGTIVLKQGSSLVAWLDSTTVRALKHAATARLMRMTMAPSPTLGDRLSQPVAESPFNGRGVVQLAPIPPGTYTLEVTAPGFAPAQVDQITVYERSESALRMPIRLAPPVTIHLSIQPPRDPSGAPWRLAVDRTNPLTFRRSHVAEGIAAEGRFDVEGQAPGRFTVVATDRNGNIYARRDLDIHSDADARASIEVGAIHLLGTLTAARQSLAGDLLFGGHSGVERISTEAGDDGKFEVVLPHAGQWAVDVDGKGGILAAVTATIDDKNDEVNIELPDTKVGGWVTGIDGRRLAGAVVTLYTSSGVVTKRSDAEGAFVFRGVSTGSAKINASDSRSAAHSRFLEIPIAEGAYRDGLELVLQNMTPLKGVVMSEGQPVIGARVTGYGLGAGVARQERAVSGLDGGFELPFPDSATNIALIVSAPGRTLQAFSTPPTDKPVVLEVASAGGVLRLRMPPGSSRPAVSYNGTPIPMPELLAWARAQDPASFATDSLSVANVAPGNYSFCVLRGAAGEVCRDGLLSQGATLILSGE